MNEYYNFEISEHEISYEPYWYDKSKIVLFFILGTVVLIVASILYQLNIFEESLLIGSFLSIILFGTGIYRWFIKNKTILVFNKIENNLYQINPLRKKRLIELHNAQSITTVSKHFNYYYTLSKKNSSKKIVISPAISHKKKNNPEIRFLEMEIIPKIESFLQLQKDINLFN